MPILQPHDGGGDPTTRSGVEAAPGVRIPEAALRFSAARSSGPGGQNVNKRATKIELRLDLADIPISPAAMSRLRRAASHLITEGGELVIAADEHRTQLGNRRACLERLRAIIIHAKAIPKPRVATKPSRGSVERRLETKRQTSQKKEQRRSPLP